MYEVFPGLSLPLIFVQCSAVAVNVHFDLRQGHEQRSSRESVMFVSTQCDDTDLNPSSFTALMRDTEHM